MKERDSTPLPSFFHFTCYFLLFNFVSKIISVCATSSYYDNYESPLALQNLRVGHQDTSQENKDLSANIKFLSLWKSIKIEIYEFIS